MKKGRGLGKHAGHAVIDWVEKHVDGMTSIKLPSNATPFMKKFQIRKIDCNNDIIRRVKAEFGTRCFGQHVRIDRIALHQANTLRQKLLMSLQQFQLFLGKDDFPVQLWTRENAAITSDDMKTEK